MATRRLSPREIDRKIDQAYYALEFLQRATTPYINFSEEDVDRAYEHIEEALTAAENLLRGR
jgi:hypothetical protein